MEYLRTVLPQNVVVEYKLPGIGRRIAASGIDLCIQTLFLLISLYLVKQLNEALNRSIPEMFFFILILLPVLLYDLLMEVTLDGQSIGKKLLHLYVIDISGASPTLSSLLLRWLFRLVENIFVFTNAMALLTVLINGKGQRMGDLAAGTAVVFIPKGMPALPPLLAQPAITNEYHPKWPQALHLIDRDIDIIMELMELHQRDSAVPLHDLAARVATTLHIPNHQVEQPFEFLQQITRDYLYFSAQAQRHA
jgi:uncharacterized RDD family membrane protein YckC